MTSHTQAAAARPLMAARRFTPRLSLPLGRQGRRRLALIALVCGALAAGYLAWFRDSSLVRVDRVHVSGLATAPDAGRVRADLTAAAERMSTLHLDVRALRRIAARSPVVHSIEVFPDFPHGLAIRVTENRPVAMLVADGGRVPVAADGTLLEGVRFEGSLPEVRTAAALPQNGRLLRGGALDRVSAAGAAPAPLLRKVSAITIQPGRGYVAQLDGGPAIWLGSGDKLEEKWDAAAAVLAQRSSAGATYVDVRMPERAVAGGLSLPALPADPAPDAEAPASGATGPSDSTTVPQSASPAPATPAPTVPQNPQLTLQP
jgi:cell division protein FtsQ